jgi:uncharacterized protein
MKVGPKNSANGSSSAVNERSLAKLQKNELGQMAKDLRIVGWHRMRKHQLVRALAVARRAAGQPLSDSPPPARRSAGQPASDLPAEPSRTLDHTCKSDRIIVLTRDSWWLHAYWELSRTTLSRARAALGQEWATARPILRVMDVSSEDDASASERHVRDISIHGGLSNWYIDVLNPPCSYRVDIGYVAQCGKFYVLARSNIVTTPAAGSAADALDENWANVQKQFERIHGAEGSSRLTPVDLRDLFEERLRRPMGGLASERLSTSAPPPPGRGLQFEVDAELIVYGKTDPDARVTLQGEPAKLRSDGSFTIRFSLPDSRQIIPVVGMSSDGMEERTIVLAVERNTKELEPMIHDDDFLYDYPSQAFQATHPRPPSVGRVGDPAGLSGRIAFSSPHDLPADEPRSPAPAVERETVIVHESGRSISEYHDLPKATPESQPQPVTPEGSTQTQIQEEPKGEGETHTITEFAVSDRTYPLRTPCLARYESRSPGQVEYLVQSFEPLFVGRGSTRARAKADWIEQVHSAFQFVYRKMPFEMTPSESAQWSLLEQAVDVNAYTRQTPAVVRQLGKVLKVRHAPCEVVWLDGSKDAVSLSAAPAEFAGFPLGQWFEALVERDPGTWHLRRILNVARAEPPDRMPREALKRFWASLPTTSALPKSTRDWTEK